MCRKGESPNDTATTDGKAVEVATDGAKRHRPTKQRGGRSERTAQNTQRSNPPKVLLEGDYKKLQVNLSRRVEKPSAAKGNGLRSTKAQGSAQPMRGPLLPVGLRRERFSARSYKLNAPYAKNYAPRWGNASWWAMTINLATVRRA